MHSNILANLLTTVKENASKLATPISKPHPRAQMFAKKAVGIQNNLLNLIKMDPEEQRPGPTITSEFQERKEKEVKKNVSNVRNNLKNLF